MADQFRVALLPLVIALGPTLKVTVGAVALMDTVADWAAVPPAPVHVRVYVVLADSTPVDCEPLTGLEPDQPPEAEQEVALAALQVSVELVPEAIVLGAAARVTLGAADFTDTVADCVALPPLPVQVKE